VGRKWDSDPVDGLSVRPWTSSSTRTSRFYTSIKPSPTYTKCNHPETIYIMEASNLRPIAILLSYLTLAFLLSLSIIGSLLTCSTQSFPPNSKTTIKLPPRRNAIYLFSALAALSLGSTWFYMFSFFARSYRDWAAVAVPNSLDLGGWLRDSALFKEAWGVAISSGERFWWTGQIFPFTTLWSFCLGVEGLFLFSSNGMGWWKAFYAWFV
jgi:hypothetical protein